MSIAQSVRHPFRMLKRGLPRGLFGRSLLIIIMPIVILQGIVTYAFFERHYDVVTRHMAQGVAGEVAYLVKIVNTAPTPQERDKLLMLAAQGLNYQISFQPGAHVENPPRHRAIDDALTGTFRDQLGGARKFHTQSAGDYLDLRVEVKGGVLRMMIPQKRLTASNVDVFILWMVISSLILIGIAALFLRNQVRPIERLARAADAFGKGRSVPDFKPYGAREVRSAAQSFITMRERIERYVQQRTEMLAGVSHDIKTPLTRLKLQLAMMDDNADAKSMRQDVIEMEHMLDEYLDFARGEGGEEAKPADVSTIVHDAAAAAAQTRHAGAERLTVNVQSGLVFAVRSNALKRCVINLVDNALKHARHVTVDAHRTERFADIVVDDDGPGIPQARREEAFRPFHRLDEGRNLQTGGSGLGLAIARDIARAHGGDLTLDTSPMGGLRATIRLPV
jgi:two-component system osmolarity sensor histidine kinase EnvZ